MTDKGRKTGKTNIHELLKPSQEALNKVAAEAINRVHKAGYPTTHCDEDGNLYWLPPDGKKEYVKKLPPVIPNEKEMLTRISTEAITKAHAAGISTAHSDDLGLYWLHPGGGKEYFVLNVGRSQFSVKMNEVSQNEYLVQISDSGLEAAGVTPEEAMRNIKDEVRRRNL